MKKMLESDSCRSFFYGGFVVSMGGCLPIPQVPYLLLGLSAMVGHGDHGAQGDSNRSNSWFPMKQQMSDVRCLKVSDGKDYPLAI